MNLKGYVDFRSWIRQPTTLNKERTGKGVNSFSIYTLEKTVRFEQEQWRKTAEQDRAITQLKNSKKEKKNFFFWNSSEKISRKEGLGWN